MDHVFAHLDDPGGKFMAQNLRQGRIRIDVRRGRRNDRAGHIFVQVGPAYPADQRLNEDHVVTERAGWGWHILHADILFCIVAYGLHRDFLSLI
jgi:hypothetical protein